MGGKVVLVASLLVALAGCVNARSDPARRDATRNDLEQARRAYWFEQPDVVRVSARRFDPLWKACEATAGDYLFDLDRLDYRAGLITTKPLVSKQWFELWKRDVSDPGQLAVSSVATMRRTVHFDIERADDGSYVMSPRVLVERQTLAGPRVTSASQYQSVFAAAAPTAEPYGSPEADAGINLPTYYWYSVGRDEAMERELAKAVEARVGKGQALARSQ
ncbi:MAG: hypothetical protein ACREIT_02885 [Tepidisphaeraceae bacterium]